MDVQKLSWNLFPQPWTTIIIFLQGKFPDLQFMVFNTMNVRVVLRYPLDLPLFLVRFLLECKWSKEKVMFYIQNFVSSRNGPEKSEKHKKTTLHVHLQKVQSRCKRVFLHSFIKYLFLCFCFLCYLKWSFVNTFFP